MKIKLLAIAMHVLVWVALLVIPFASTDQIFISGRSIPTYYVMFCLVLSAVMIGSFYFNHFVLIRIYLVRKKYVAYFSSLLLTIIAVIALLAFLSFYTDIRVEAFVHSDPIIEKVMPVIIVNAILLWSLAIVSSILWTFYNRLKRAETEKLNAQIASLKYQINPHFLFNTLNNIYATTIETSPKAADMIDKLSEMMRYTMKDTQSDVVLLEDEINYISSFVQLQQLRLDEKVKLTYLPLENPPPLQIAPMLLIPFVENAFKHGVNAEEQSNIHISMSINKQEFTLKVVNHKVSVQREISQRSGLGIENTRHRLNLIYPSKHLLVIDDGEVDFSVSLHINLA